MREEKYIDYTDEVYTAVKSGKPVVALESTIISHGMPYPANIETASECESIVRKNGAVPATMAVLDGRIKAGITENELEFLAKGENILKASRRDLPHIISEKKNAATTVAATMICADLAGIKIFATGGTGGVHRGGENSLDISADLEEFAKTNVAVISAGAKSILDLGLTLEYLETAGVPVIGYKTEYFPAFYTRSSGFNVNSKIDTPKEAAKLIYTKWEMGLKGGVLIANPIPENYAMDQKIIEGAIEKALYEASEKKVTGKEVTPFLLSRIKELTDGDSLESNIALVYNNVELAAQIAVEYAKLK